VSLPTIAINLTKICDQIAWPLIANFSCEATAKTCSRSENRGWRYFLFTMGGLMLLFWFLRFFVFKLYESPKYLVGRGRDAEAVDVVHKVAEYNGVQSSLSIEQLLAVDREYGSGKAIDASAGAAVKRTLSIFDMSRVKVLFATRKMAYSTSLLIILWGKHSTMFGG
jgi:hypothetical protein